MSFCHCCFDELGKDEIYVTTYLIPICKRCAEILSKKEEVEKNMIKNYKDSEEWKEALNYIKTLVKYNPRKRIKLWLYKLKLKRELKRRLGE